jgi:hypothetical protein
MFLHGAASVFFVGFLGGWLGELLALWELRHDPSSLPKYLGSPYYWIMNVVMACLGGGLATLYGYKEVSAMLVVNIGASAPLILKSLATNAPRIQPTKVD